MELIGYTYSYIPVELLSLTGFQPYALLHGDIGLSQQGENFVRVDACPFIKSNLSYLTNNKDKFKAVVGSTGCDMSRRMFDILNQVTEVPVYLINVPRTDRPRIFYDEIDWLFHQLEYLAQKKFTSPLIAEEIDKWEKEREYYRKLNALRETTPSLMSTSQFHQIIINYYQGNIGKRFEIKPEQSNKPRVYLLGSTISYESNQILQLLEKDLRIVGDFINGLSRNININIKNKTLDGIKSAYYNQISDIVKRPNYKYYEYIKSELQRLNCVGIVAWTLDYCDSYEFELKRIESEFNLPLLKIRSDYSFQNISQLKVRINAFAEIL
ncbi:MAG: 2-hydroxyacyl-CoA dehydratase family protein [candidate division WOR-3 bacterium]|nr:2-hydroxyacyl-CoA dehydratase family protein [candidate division WOR-3 bacterium]